MDKVLSQEEINALFSAMSTADLGIGGRPDKDSSPRKIVRYDFHRADHISQDQMRSVRLLHEAFGRNFASSLSAYLRVFVDVTVASVEQVPYAAFVRSLPDPTLFASIGIRPPEGNIAMELNPSLVFPMIDIILGGPGCALSENRDLTEIELNVVEGVLKLAMRDLRGAWNPVTDLDFFLEGKGTRAQAFQIASPAESVLAVHLGLKIGEKPGMMNLCIPCRILKLLRNRSDQQWNVRRQQSTRSEAERIFELMKLVPIPLSGEIRSSKLTVDDLLKISVGDVIELNEPISDPASLCVGGIAKFLGRIVQRRGKMAFEISSRFLH
jgi:flagellar motor switch protein FliM